MNNIIETLKTKILNPIEGFLIVLATLFFLWGVVEFISGASSEDKRTQGKHHMMWGMLGLAIILGARGIINVLDNFFK